MRYHEFIGVFVSSDPDPITGEHDSCDLPATINLDAVEAFNDGGDGCTTVRLQMGDNLMLRIPYAKFKRLFLYSTSPVN